MTPEERERMIVRRAQLEKWAVDHFPNNGYILDLAAYRIALDGEPDRRLGSLARACRADLIGPLELLADALERSKFHVPGCARLNRDRAASLREFAAALREESER